MNMVHFAKAFGYLLCAFWWMLRRCSTGYTEATCFIYIWFHWIYKILALHLSASASILPLSSCLPLPLQTELNRAVYWLSLLIFAMAMEPVIKSIRKNRAIQGIRVGSHQHKIGLYTDDIILSITNPLCSLQYKTRIMFFELQVGYHIIKLMTPSPSSLILVLMRIPNY